MDSNADTCCLRASFIVLEHTQRCANVYPYDDNMSPIVVPIVNGATAYDCERSGQTYIFHTKGTKLYFRSRAPTDQELRTCTHVDLTSKAPWNPSEVQLSQLTSEESRIEIDEGDPRTNDHDLHVLDPVLDMRQWRRVNQVQVFDPRSTDVPTRATFESSDRHPRISPQILAERWGITTERASKTLQATLQQSTRSAMLPLARRYRADRMFMRPRLEGKFSTDTAYFKCKSLIGNVASSQIYFHKCGFYANFKILKTDDAN